jgi:hypothetical protein
MVPHSAASGSHSLRCIRTIQKFIRRLLFQSKKKKEKKNKITKNSLVSQLKNPSKTAKGPPKFSEEKIREKNQGNAEAI